MFCHCDTPANFRAAVQQIGGVGFVRGIFKAASVAGNFL